MTNDLSVIVVSAAVILGIFPIVQYLVLGHQEQKRDILGSFDQPAIKAYLSRYYANLISKNGSPEEELEEMYDGRFGRRTYFFPIAIYVLALILVVLVIVASAFETMASSMLSAFRVPDQVAYALAGAYLWVLSDLLNRYRRRDLVSWAFYDGAFRFAIAIPVAYSISWIVDATGEGETTEAASNALAFMLGTFPTNTLLTLLRRNLAQRLRLGDDSEHGNELESIQGVNTSLAERFGEIGITTFHALAYEDQIQLTMRMNLRFRVILDLMAQALLALYVENPLLTKAKTEQAAARTTDRANEGVDDKQEVLSDSGGQGESKDQSPAGHPQEGIDQAQQAEAAGNAPAAGTGEGKPALKDEQEHEAFSTPAGADRSILPVYRKYLIRSALDAKVLCDKLGKKGREQSLAQAVLRSLAQDLQMDPDIVEYILGEVANDPATKFFWVMPIV